MTLRSEIQVALQAAVTELTESWTYQLMTSGYAVSPRTYGTAGSLLAHPTGRQETEEYDDNRQVWVQRATMRLRVPDGQTILKMGDLAIDPTGLFWTVRGIDTQAPRTGSIAYRISRDLSKLAEPDRKGGV